MHAATKHDKHRSTWAFQITLLLNEQFVYRQVGKREKKQKASKGFANRVQQTFFVVVDVVVVVA